MAKRGDQRHVLVINDTPEILDLFRDLLGDEGYRVTTDNFAAPFGQKLQEVKELRPDLIILDFIIGGEEFGWQFLQMLKMDRGTRNIPVIVCTAAVTQVRELQNHLDQMGVAVVLKPFDLDVLLAELDRVWTKVAEGHFPERTRPAEDA
jgi:CheY-like chemotaxis protein